MNEYHDTYSPITSSALSQIPASMKAENRWVPWGGDKVPVNGNMKRGGKFLGADATDPRSWMPYEKAVGLIGQECLVRNEFFHVAGIAFVVGDGWFCVDMDGGEKHGKEPVPEDAVHETMDLLRTYTETSLSGSGYHVFGKSDTLKVETGYENYQPNERKDSYELELFARRKPVILSGNRVKASALDAVDCGSAASDYYHSHIFTPRKRQEERRIAAMPARTMPVDADAATQMFLNCYREILAASDSSNFRRDQWVGLVKAMRDTGIPFSDVLDWCKRGSNFKNDKDVERVWNESRGPRNRPASVAALVSDAKDHGWRPRPDQRTGEYSIDTRNKPVKDDHHPVVEMIEGIAVHTVTPPEDSKPTGLPSAQEDKVPPLETFDSEYFNNTEIPEPVPIIERILYPGLCLLGSPAKMGKSYMMLQLAVAVATGESFLGFAVKRPGSVLYLDLQGTKARTKKRLSSMGYMTMPPGISVAYRARNTDTGFLQQIEQWISNAKNPTLVIVDMVQQIKGSQRKTEDAYSADNRILEPLHDIGTKHNISVFGVMHTRKGNSKVKPEDPFNEIIGSIAQFGVADCAWMILGKRDENKKQLSVICRDCDDGQQDFEAVFKDHRWNISGTIEEIEECKAVTEYNNSPIVFTIRELIRESGGGWLGTMRDLIREVSQKTGEYPAPSPEKMSFIVKNMSYRLFKEGIGIDYIGKSGGANGRRYRFYRRTPEQMSVGI